MIKPKSPGFGVRQTLAYIPPLALSRGVILIFLPTTLDLLCMWCPSNAVWDSVRKIGSGGSDREQTFTCTCIFLLILCSNEWAQHTLFFLSLSFLYPTPEFLPYDPQWFPFAHDYKAPNGFSKYTTDHSFLVWLLSSGIGTLLLGSLGLGLELLVTVAAIDLVQIGLCGITKGAVKTYVLVITAKGI